ncbi:chemotaxis protein CheA [Erythrobacter litoralis]|uniref:Chemotaxis protein CheA n=1 Tax=Erythrobacter litoralis (strain HTCC2594) TaxID=314225 RepID=Q2N7J6_ERYLH|nr:chemotaxis protein CheA [Erythrobacter litoralis]ABC64345.1 chemotaxis protein CheA [Erythrobacter litoralis HTCC2594]
MDDLLAEFIAETREMLGALGGELVAWEAAPDDRDRLDAIFRFVHTVKGNCGFFDFPRLEALSHAAEDALGEVRAGRRIADPALVSAVLAIIDRIGDLTSAIETGEEIPHEGDDALVLALAHDPDRAEEASLAENAAEVPVTPKATVAQRSIRLPVELLDRMMSGVSDLVLARNDLSRVLGEIGSDPRLDGPFERMTAILDDVRDAATRMRMQRIEVLFSAMPRMVRDLGRELGKQVMIDLEGGDVELDREMIESIRDPLTHILRNAVDHGLESPAERAAAGKREIGVVSISARQAGNQIYLTVSDDGRGIDADRLVDKAVAADAIDAADIDAMSLADKHNLIFAPGLSTAAEVSAISGRGVGMDVVRANIEKIGGTIGVSSRPGEGTTIQMRFPLTLSIIATLTVSSAGQKFALPRSGVEEVIFGSDPDLEYTELGDGRFITFRGQRIPCIVLSEVLGQSNDSAIEGRTFIVVRFSASELSAFIVDRVIDHEEAVIKPVAPAITATRLYTGATLLSDGTPVLALDLTSIAVDRGIVTDGRSRALDVDVETAGEVEAAEHARIMLFVDYEGQQRAVEMDHLERIETIPAVDVEVHAGSSRAVIDGRLRILGGLGGIPIETSKLRALRLRDGDREGLFAVRAIVDVAPLAEPISDDADEPLTRGYAQVAGRPVPVLSPSAVLDRWGDRIAAEADR